MPMRSLQNAFREEFLRVLAKTGMSRSEAAAQIGISRQAFHAYLVRDGSIPSKNKLRRIVEIWPDFCVLAGGQKFDKESLSPPDLAMQPVVVAKQLQLVELLQTLGPENLGISVRQEGKSTRVSLTIKIPA
jgi:hypothetical protein